MAFSHKEGAVLQKLVKLFLNKLRLHDKLVVTIYSNTYNIVSDKIVVTFSTLPQHGSLTVGHRTISGYTPNVTLTELENDELMYENNGDMDAIDRFSFLVSDGVNAGYYLLGRLDF